MYKNPYGTAALCSVYTQNLGVILPTVTIFYRWSVHDHMGAAEEEEDQIKRLLREEAQDREAITEELLLEIYDLEDDLSTMELRHGITDGIQSALESHVDKENGA